MIVIGICDGEQTVRSLVAGYVERYHAETGVEIQLLSYNTGEKLLKNYMLDMDIIFLEIPFQKISGLKIAESIKKWDSQVRIVFLTTVLSYVLEAYEAGASNYLLKPLSYSKFCRELSHRLGITSLADRILVFQGGRIVEDGSHQELMAQKGHYYNMYQAQAKWYTTLPGRGTC